MVAVHAGHWGFVYLRWMERREEVHKWMNISICLICSVANVMDSLLSVGVTQAVALNTTASWLAKAFADLFEEQNNLELNFRNSNTKHQIGS